MRLLLLIYKQLTFEVETANVSTYIAICYISSPYRENIIKPDTPDYRRKIAISTFKHQGGPLEFNPWKSVAQYRGRRRQDEFAGFVQFFRQQNILKYEN